LDFLGESVISGSPEAERQGLSPKARLHSMTLEERLKRYLGRTPDTSAALFVASTATVLGDVVLGPRSSVFYGAVIRGDINEIRVGEGTNIQDNAVIHLADEWGVHIGAWCTIGHGAIVHACTIGDECLIGMGATLLDGAVIGARSIVGAQALVTQRFECPPGSLVHGSPARVIRPLSDAEQQGLRPWAQKYVEVARAHAALGKGASARA
jgi:gamma-carbonic anhydrase